MIEQAYEILYTGLLMFLGVCMLAGLWRTIRGPRTADRIIGVNMVSTLVIMALAILCFVLELRDLADVCLVYALAGFLGVLVLTKIYVTVYRQRKAEAERKDGDRNA